MILAWDRRGRIAPEAIQDTRLLADLDPGERLASVHLVAPDGERRSAGPALAPLLRLLPGGRLPAVLLAAMPRVTGRAYDWVAGHRSGLSRLVPERSKRRARERVRRA